MRITFLVDNLPHPTLPLLTEHGLSLYIETDDFISGTSTSSVTEIGTRILCDMGASGAYLKNAKALGIDLNTCHWAFLSHAHADHIGGLGKWIAQYGHIPVYASHHIPALQCFSSRPKKVASQRSQVASLMHISEESTKRLNDSTTKQQEFNSPHHRITASPERSELRSIGPDLNLFCGHTPWFKPIEQNTWISPSIALVHPTCQKYSKPLGNKYLTVVESQCEVSAEANLFDYAEPMPDFMSEANKVESRKSKVESQCKVSEEASLLGYAEAQPDFMSEANKVESQKSKVESLMHISEESIKRLNDSTTKQQEFDSPKRSEIDPFDHEIALCFVTPKGLVIVSCCSHHGALNTITSCMEFTGCNTLHAYIGGLHFVDSPEVEAETTSFISDWFRLYPNAHLYTGHCTCPRAATLLKAHLPHCHTFYTGNVVEV